MKKIAFVINPNAGGNRKVNRLDLIRKLVPAGLDHEFFLWKKREDKDELLQNVLNSDCDIVAAVGGDGTVNSVAAAVCGTTKTLAIIPFGSGNGTRIQRSKAGPTSCRLSLAEEAAVSYQASKQACSWEK